METKKISFGFSRIQNKQKSVPSAKEEDKKQFIECLEEKSIKVKDWEEDKEKKPLVIPLKNNSTTGASVSRIVKEIALTALKDDFTNGIREESDDTKCEDEIKPPVPMPSKQETLEEQATRELLEGAKNIKKEDIKVSTIPISKLPSIAGEKESNLDDYESIPIADFGLAMLRGMGWQPGTGIGKKNESVDLTLPKMRPKGMGLGADKVVKKVVANGNDRQKDEELKIVKGAFIKVINGNKSGSYGQITGFDEDSGRLIAKMAIYGDNLNISEFMVEPVTKDEYNRNSKILNASKYEIYKRKDDDDRRRKEARRPRD